jgi:hypothetical protein
MRARAGSGSTWSPRGEKRPSSPRPSGPLLELTEQGTRLGDASGGASDEAGQNAAQHYDDDQLAALVSLIALINVYNRVRQPAGDYQPGAWG